MQIFIDGVMNICISMHMSTLAYIPIDYDHLICLSAQMADHVDRSEATLSTWCVGHARLFSRLRDGKGCNAHTYRDALEWFSDNWPEDLTWPADVPRPDPTQKARKPA